jgi:hypothetical protein
LIASSGVANIDALWLAESCDTVDPPSRYSRATNRRRFYSFATLG